MKFDYVFNHDGIGSSEFSHMHHVSKEANLIFRKIVFLHELLGKDQTLKLKMQNGRILLFELEYPEINVFKSDVPARQYFLRELRQIGSRSVDGMCMTVFALGYESINTWFTSRVFPMALKCSPADKDEESVCQTMDCHVNSFLVEGNRQHCRVAEAFMREINMGELRHRNELSALNTGIFGN